MRCARAFGGDASRPDPALAARPFDRVLCDVPCSGLGVIGKKPDIRYKDLAGLDDLTALQAAILQNGALYLAPGGRLVYSTCTINRGENEAVVRAFLEKEPNFVLEKPEMSLPGAQDTGFGTLFLPHRTGTDGFFVAVLAKTKG